MDADSSTALLLYIASRQTAPFTTDHLLSTYAGFESLSVDDAECVLARSNQLLSRDSTWYPIAVLRKACTPVLAWLGDDHEDRRPAEALTLFELHTPSPARTWTSTRAARALIFLEDAPEVRRHADGCVQVARTRLPALRPAPYDSASRLSVRHHNRDRLRPDALSIQIMLRADLANPYVRSIRLLGLSDRRPTYHAAPVRFEPGSRLAAWTPPINAARAEELSALGWWIWDAEDRDVLRAPSRLVAQRPLPGGKYRAAVLAPDSIRLAQLLTASLLLDHEQSGATSLLTVDKLPIPPQETDTRSRRWKEQLRREQNRRPALRPCLRCGQPLSDDLSVQRGFGPDCFEKVRAEFNGDLGFLAHVEEQLDEPATWHAALDVADWLTQVFG